MAQTKLEESLKKAEDSKALAWTKHEVALKKLKDSETEKKKQIEKLEANIKSDPLKLTYLSVPLPSSKVK